MKTSSRFFDVSLRVVHAHLRFVRLVPWETLSVMSWVRLGMCWWIVRLAHVGWRRLSLIARLLLNLTLVGVKWIVEGPTDLRVNLINRRRHVPGKLLLIARLVIVVLCAGSSVAHLWHLLIVLLLLLVLLKLLLSRLLLSSIESSKLLRYISWHLAIIVGHTC